MIVRELVALLKLRGAEQATQQARRFDAVARGIRGTLFQLSAGFASAFSVRALFLAGDAMQSFEARVAQLPQTVGSAADAFDRIAAGASAARQPVGAYANLYIRLAGATKAYVKDQAGVLAMTDSVAKALVIGGASAGEQAAALLQISQAFQKGKMDGDEFRTFMEVMSTDFKDKLAKELGTTTDQLYAWSEAGKITARGMAEAFQRMGGDIEKQFKNMPITVGQAFFIIGNRLSMLVHRFNRESHFITRTANFLIAGFDKLEQGIVFVARALDRAAKAVGGWGRVLRVAAAAILAFPVVRFLKWVGLIIPMLRRASAVVRLFGRTSRFLAPLLLGLIGLRGALRALIRLMLRIPGVAIFTAIALAIEDVIVWMQGGASVTEKLLGKFEGFRAIPGQLMKAWGNFKAWFFGLMDDLAARFKEFVSGLRLPTWAELTRGLARAVVAPARIAGAVGQATADPRSWFGGGGASDVTAGVAAGAPRTVVNMPVNERVTINVPPGTREEQTAAIDQQVRRKIREQFDRMMRETLGDVPAYQGG